MKRFRVDYLLIYALGERSHSSTATQRPDRLKHDCLSGLGICIMNDKQVLMWNTGIAMHGFYLYLIAIFASVVSYIMLTCSLSEMVSIVPFSGGCYGYVRCTMGPTLGYITGVMEASKYVLYSAATCYLLGLVFSSIYDFDPDTWLPVLWLAFYILGALVSIIGHKMIWWCWGVLALATLTTQLIFVAGAMKEGKVRNLKPYYNEYDGGMHNFIEILPYASLLFTGIDDVRTCASNHVSSIVFLIDFLPC